MTATLTPARAMPALAPGTRSRRELAALAVLLTGTALLLLWNLGASGWANSYYAAAVRSMTQNWTAFLFGSLDAGNIVTVDKPPGSLWVMALSARLFGFSSWNILVPQALMGIATVALVYAAVRRAAGPAAGLVAGAAMALTPVAVVMFRFDNPDALLVLLLVAAAYATVRAIETASTRWLVLAGALIGAGFLAKMAQALVVVPALALSYLVAAPTGFWRRVRQLLTAGLAVVVAAGWWVALVELWPASSRPYIGGSTDDSVLQLALGYNGLGRIFGGEGRGGGRRIIGDVGVPMVERGPGPHGAFVGGGPGQNAFGGEPGPLRMFGEAVGGQAAWLLPAALLLLVTGLWSVRRTARTDRLRASLLLWGAWAVVTALVFSLAQGIFHPYYTVALAPGIAALVGIGGVLLWRTRASWPGRAGLAVLVAGTAVWAVVLLGRTPGFLPWLRWVVLAVAAVAVLALLAGVRRRPWTAATALAVLLAGGIAPAAYAVETAVTPHNGPIPMAGPSPGEPGRGMRVTGGMPRTDPEVVALLQKAGTRWSAATVGAQGSATLSLASDTTVMGIGGFSGSDPAPTPEEFQALVAAGQVHYFVTGGGPERDSEITRWVREHFTPTTYGQQTVYDLTHRPSARRGPVGLQESEGEGPGRGRSADHSPHRQTGIVVDTVERVRGTVRTVAEQVIGTARALAALTRSGVVRPLRPDRLVGMAAGLVRYGLTITGGYAMGAARHPDRTAVVDDAGSFTFAELATRTDAMARGLGATGVGPGVRVGVLCRNHRGAIEAQVAVGKLGADVVLLNTGLSAHQLRDVATDLGLHTLVADDEFAEAVAELPDGCRVLGDLEGLDGPGPLPRRPPAGRTIVLTSGTSGPPKGARRPPVHSISPAAAILSVIPLRAAEPVLISAPLLHTWGLAALQLAVLHGAPVVLTRRFDPAGFLRIAEEQRCDAVFAVPVMLQRVLELPADDLDGAWTTHRPRIVAVSGSALPGELAGRFMDRFGEILYNLYGSTEVSWVSIGSPRDLRLAPGTAGRAPAGTRLVILDDDGRAVAPGTEGRIFVRNDMPFEGYTREGADVERSGDLLGTGDVGRLDEHGLLHITGRADDMIVSGGENVHPGPVEELLEARPEVREAAVTGVDDEQFGQRLAAYVVLADGAQVDADDVRGWVRAELSRFAVPRDVVFVDELPRNSTGKVVHRELRPTE